MPLAKLLKVKFPDVSAVTVAVAAPERATVLLAPNAPNDPEME